MYETYEITLLDGQLNAARKVEVVLPPVQGTHLDTTYITDVYREKRTSVIIMCMPGMFWNECSLALPTSFSSILQVFGDKTARTL